MSGRIVVTAGTPFLDIDAYAASVAYAAFLTLRGKRAVAASSARPNRSVTATVTSWGAGPEAYSPEPGDVFVLVDVSDPRFFDPLVRLDAVREVVDHHAGFERYWQERLGDMADVEFIGACATQVFERWEKAGLTHLMPVPVARLLLAAILENTLNFGAGVTTARDRRAYDALQSMAGLPAAWPGEYFREMEGAVTADIAGAIRDDVKVRETAGLPPVFGQIAVWDGAAFVRGHGRESAAAMRSYGPEWMLNILSLGDGAGYVLAEGEKSREDVRVMTGCSFEGALTVMEKAWLRKEFYKKALASGAPPTA